MAPLVDVNDSQMSAGNSGTESQDGQVCIL
jgi:hypothetical protein